MRTPAAPPKHTHEKRHAKSRSNSRAYAVDYKYTSKIYAVDYPKHRRYQMNGMTALRFFG